MSPHFMHISYFQANERHACPQEKSSDAIFHYSKKLKSSLTATNKGIRYPLAHLKLDARFLGIIDLVTIVYFPRYLCILLNKDVHTLKTF